MKSRDIFYCYPVKKYVLQKLEPFILKMTYLHLYLFYHFPDANRYFVKITITIINYLIHTMS